MFLTTGMTTFDSVLQLLGLIVLLAIIIAATYFTTRFIGKFQSNQMRKSNFNVIESYRITQGKYLQIVKISSKYFVIALGKDEITFITQLEEDEILLKDDMDFKHMNFSEYLSNFMSKKNDKTKNKNLFGNKKDNDYTTHNKG